uniref:MI domain-containing protein n=1 Tax=Heterorhabditis bacteriophora TaxID=37862 RepID=A0A1I7XQ85_HETBA
MAKNDASRSTDGQANARDSNNDTSKDLLRSRTGGAYIPPAKLKLMQEKISDKVNLTVRFFPTQNIYILGTTITVSKFIAHLINQNVAHEVLALEIMILMLESPTDDSVEVSIAFLKECGARLTQVAPRALSSIFDRLRAVLNEANSNELKLDKRIQYMIEVAMKIRKDKFKAYPSVTEELDLIDEDDQITHTLTLEEAVNPENELNVFKMDVDFEKNEAMYEEIRAEIIGSADDSDDEEEDNEDDNDEEKDREPETATPMTEIIDNTEQNLVAFRREVYLTIQSSLDYQEAAHKLLKMRVKKELELCLQPELCHMLVDCCCQQRTYERFYGLLCERFCRLRKEFQVMFEQIARDTYSTVHRFDITKLRNMSKLISHLLFTDAISWNILSDIRLTEEETTSSGRIYIKYIFQELCESMGLVKLYERTRDPTLQIAFAGLFPRDNPADSRFAINFFTLIGLGGLTVHLREFLQKGKRKSSVDEPSSGSSTSSDSSDSESSDSDSDSSSESSSDSSDEDEDREKQREEKKQDRIKNDRQRFSAFLDTTFYKIHKHEKDRSSHRTDNKESSNRRENVEKSSSHKHEKDRSSRRTDNKESSNRRENVSEQEHIACGLADTLSYVPYNCETVGNPTLNICEKCLGSQGKV